MRCASAALALALGLISLGYYRTVAAQKDAPAALGVEVELLPGESAKVIDVTTRPLVPVVIYGSAEVDAASLWPATVAVAGAPPTKRAHGLLRAELKDLNHDGRDDLLITVAAQSLRVGEGDNRITVTAATRDGRRVIGTTQARIVHARRFEAAAPEPKVTVANTTPITINDGASPPTAATPYPSNIAVSGVTGNVVGLTVTLTNLSHTFPDDIDVLLVGPTGANVLLMSDVGGGTAASHLNLTFDDNAAASLPDNGPLVSGTFKPTNFVAGDTFPAPAPAPTGNVLLSVFDGTNPNGTWSLYVVDDNTNNAGSIAGGWSLNLLVAPPNCNPANIDINDSASPPTLASPYPSQINISGLTGNVAKVTVDLKDLTHTFSDDIDILLVGPTGATAAIMSDAGGSFPIFHLNLTFDDNAATALADNSQLTSGTYRPANYEPGTDSWPMVSPPPSANSALSVFNGTNPNGIWKLYIVDDEDGDSGNIAMGWCLNIATTVPTLARVSSQSATVSEDGRASVEWNASYEADNLGFNVYREAGGKRLRVNREMIAGAALVTGQGVELATGRTYHCLDQLPAGTRSARYWIEAVGLDGSSDWHGPVTTRYVPGLSADAATSPSLAGLGGGRDNGGHEDDVSNLTIQTVPQTAPVTALKLYIKQTGVYRVTQAELLAAGLNPNVDPRMLQLYEEGREQPMAVPGEQDGRFDAEDAIEFYATAPDSVYTTEKVYWLIAGNQPGRRINQALVKDVAPGAASFLATAELRERTVYFSSLRNGERENFFGAVVSRDAVTRSLRLSSVVSSAPATLEVILQGVTLQPHSVGVLLNGEAVGTLTFDGQSLAALRVQLAQAKLREDDNDVQLIAEGGGNDVSLVDTIRLSYWRGYRADDDVIACTAQGSQQVTVGGFRSPMVRVMDVTEAEKGVVQELAAVVRRDKSGYSAVVSAPGEGTRQLFAFAAAQMQRPAAIVADTPSSWRQPGNAASYVIITRRELMPAFTPLKLLRQQQGFSVAVIDVDDLYDEFSYGQKTPQAIKDFLAYAVASWQVGPRFVVLGGKASYDAKNYLGLGDQDVVPTKLIDTALMETASDDWFGDEDGEGLAGLAIGRLPVRTASEAAAMVAKIVGYDQVARPAGVLLVADDDSDGASFEATSDELRGLIPAGQHVEQINRGGLDPVAAKGRLLEALNRGQRVVNYYGHGNVGLWRGGLLTSSDAAQLANGSNLSLFVMMTCLNGYFHDPGLDSLSESLLKAKGGAVAVWASSGMTEPGDQAPMDNEMFRRLFDQSGGLTLGEAALRAKSAVRSSDARRTWVLLGDPATRLR